MKREQISLSAKRSGGFRSRGRRGARANRRSGCLGFPALRLENKIRGHF